MLTEPGWWPDEKDIETARKVLSFALSEEVNRLTAEAIRNECDDQHEGAEFHRRCAQQTEFHIALVDDLVERSFERFQKRLEASAGARTA